MSLDSVCDKGQVMNRDADLYISPNTLRVAPWLLSYMPAEMFNSYSSSAREKQHFF